MKNDLVISGILLSVDQFLNIKLDQITVKDLDKYPQMVRKFISSTQAAVKNSFIRGSVVRYIVLPAHEMDAELLEDASRKEHNNPNK